VVGPATRARSGLAFGALPAWRSGRPLKRWRYVGVFGPSLLACFGEVTIAGVPQGFWAVWDGRALRGRTVVRRGTVVVSAQAVRAPGVALDVIAAGEPVEVRSPHGRCEIWTRKVPLRVAGTIGARAVDAPGLMDESAGWHARVTRWSWCAGAGVAAGAGAPRVVWNLVDGIHDTPGASERTVWVDGVAREVGPVAFDGLRGVDGLRFTAEAERARHDRLVLLDSAYRQPFGRFAGVLPDGTALASGQGVMERHDVRW
jgi:hypothetical protein